jgi:predicted TIM-barrel fold metal-dependent hydrolase
VTVTYDLVSVDDHVIEPPGVWVDRLPKRYLDKGPHVIEAEDRQYWVYEGERATTMGLNAVAGKSREEFSMDPTRYSDMIPGCYDPVQRGRDLASNGIRGSLCFPTFPRFAGVTFLRAKDKELAHLCVQAYNDFMIDEWCAAVPGLFIPMIIGTLWDPELMAAEIRRCAAKGARALTFPENTHALGLPSFHSDHFDPVWEAVCETDTVVCIHIGTSGIVPLPSPDASFSIGIALAPGAAWSTCTDLIMGRIPRRFPTIKIALSEGGIGWVPFALERADRTWERHRHWSGLDDVPPSQVFRRNIWVCFIDEEMGIEARHRIGVDKIMWECDYPHADTPWPDSQKDVARLLAGVPDDDVALLTHGNAERLFRWTTRPDFAAISGNGAGGNGARATPGAGSPGTATSGDGAGGDGAGGDGRR